MTSSELPLDLLGQTSQELTQSFDYTVLDTETQIVVQQCTSEIKERLRDAAQATWEVGQKLFDVRNRLEYGQFNLWLKTEFKWSRSTAYNYIDVFEAFGSCPNFGQLDIAISALHLLSADSTPLAAREEALERAANGEKITRAKAKAITNHHRELAEVATASEPVTVDITAETIEKESSSPTVVEPIQCIEQNQQSVDKDASVGEVVQDNSAGANQFEQELLGKELDIEPLFESSKPEQAVPSATLNSSIKDQRAIQIQQGNTSVTEICKNLTATIEYFYREDLIDLLDPLSLKTLVEKLTLLVEKTEVSLKKRFNSSYSNN